MIKKTLFSYLKVNNTLLWVLYQSDLWNYAAEAKMKLLLILIVAQKMFKGKDCESSIHFFF